ncbi:MAG: HU family DNA-binding protein [Elusimicrobiota bacterium]|jgi:nucleoid DNA-binding protein|nr:HU family DNA-binding protein [Elusimicrobiota bacterium]
MNKEELINELAKHLFDKKQARAALDNTLDIIAGALKKGDKVVLSNFGTFKTKESRPVNIKNPSTGADIPVPSKTRVRFKPSENILK